ncbi:hypothetical protein B0A66_07530 [Flavobacterium hercynium]|uniref:Uncharacterized protein n=1 Tax=Flavobacterium hercynium TaxID=387094 RepID=A0A226HFJ8_9FLAO|nr:hypothetical protein B0A66_07530 [Flavobacterium hercynium]
METKGLTAVLILKFNKFLFFETFFFIFYILLFKLHLYICEIKIQYENIIKQYLVVEEFTSNVVNKASYGIVKL